MHFSPDKALHLDSMVTIEMADDHPLRAAMRDSENKEVIAT